MTDIALKIVEGCLDLEIVDGDLARDEGLETAALLSIFTDARASFSELPSGQSDRKGWWADIFSEITGDQIGSKIWLHYPGKSNNETAAAIEARTRSSLQWMVEDDVSKTPTVAATVANSELNLEVSIERPDGGGAFGFLWDGQSLRRAT